MSHQRHRGAPASREVVGVMNIISRSSTTATMMARASHGSKQGLQELLTEKTTELKHFG